MFKINPPLIETYYVVFEDAIKKRWYNRYLKTGFSHCYLMKQTEAGLFWIIINPKWSHIDIDYRLISTFPIAQDYAGEHAIVVRYDSVINPGIDAGKLGISNCVDIVMRFMGLNKFGIFTPYQLYKTIKGD